MNYPHKAALSAASPGIAPKARIKQAMLSTRMRKLRAGREEAGSNRSVFYCTWHLPSAKLPLRRSPAHTGLKMPSSSQLQRASLCT